MSIFKDRGQSNLAKDDVACMQKKSRWYLLSYSPDGSTRREGGTDAFWTLIFGEGEVIGVSDGTFERAMVVSYRLSLVIIALSLTIGRNLPSNVSDAKINQGE